MSNRNLQVLVLMISCTLLGAAAAQRTVLGPSEPAATVLRIDSTTLVQLAPEGGALGQSRCDQNGNLYLNLEMGSLVKISAQTGTTTTFGVTSGPGTGFAIPREIRNASVIDFVVRADGIINELVSSANSEYVVKYLPDGTYDSATRLETPDGFNAVGISALPNGAFLVQGELVTSAKTQARRPMAMLFNSNGSIMKELTFRRDAEFLHPAFADNRPIPEIESGTLTTGSDGNVYIMRRTKDPLVYVISPGGQLLRTVTLAAPEGFQVGGISVADARILLDFQKLSSDEFEFLYVFYEPFEGRELARFRPDNSLHGWLGCYGSGQFSFLGIQDGKRVLIRARP